MKVKFEVEIPDYEVVDVPVYYETNIMKVSNKLDLEIVERVIEKTLKIAKRDNLQNCNLISILEDSQKRNSKLILKHRSKIQELRKGVGINEVFK